MNKRYALLQHTQDALDADALHEAFVACDGLTAHDAQTAASQSSGVLVADLPREQARALRRALMQRGQYTEVADSRWAAVPQAVKCRRAVPAAKALTVYDAYGQATAIAWANVKAIAGGAVVVGDRVKVKESKVVYSRHGAELEDAEYAYRERDQLTIDIVTSAPMRRYRIESDRFDYGYLGKRKHTSSGRNTALLVADLFTHVKDTAVGSGVEQLIADARKTRRYRNALQLDRELAWLLWRRFGPGATLDGATDYRREPFVVEQAEATFTEKARKHATERVLEDNRGGLSRYLDERLKVDLALAALAGLLAGLWGFDRFGYEHVGPGEYELQPMSAVFAALVSFGIAAWLSFGALRSWRRRKYWMGG